MHEWHIYAAELDEDDDIELNSESSGYKFMGLEELESENLTPAAEKLQRKGIFQQVIQG